MQQANTAKEKEGPVPPKIKDLDFERNRRISVKASSDIWRGILAVT
jgi:hypothetical protein